MFQLDASLKPLVLDKLSRSSTVYFLLDRYWDQLVLYLLLAPLQWLHLTHLLYTTRWESYGFFGKVLVIFYVACCFTFWEGLRIFVYYTCRAVGNGDDLGKVGSRLIASASHIGKGAGPLLENISEKASKMLDKAATSLKSSSIGNILQSAGKAVTKAATFTASQNGDKSGSKSEHESQEQSQSSSAASNRTGTETSSGSETATGAESAFATESSGGSSAKE